MEGNWLKIKMVLVGSPWKDGFVMVYKPGGYISIESWTKLPYQIGGKVGKQFLMCILHRKRLHSCYNHLAVRYYFNVLSFIKAINMVSDIPCTPHFLTKMQHCSVTNPAQRPTVYCYFWTVFIKFHLNSQQLSNTFHRYQITRRFPVHAKCILTLK